MKSDPINVALVWLAGITLLGMAVGFAYLVSLTPPLRDNEAYYLVVNCGDMGTYMIEPGTLEAAHTPGMLVGVLTNGQIIKLPKSCVAYTVNAPNPKITYNNDDQGA